MAAPKLKKPFGASDMGPGGGADQDLAKGYVPKRKRKKKVETQLQEEKRMDERVLRQSDPEIEDLKKLTPMERYHQKRNKKLGMGM